MSRRCKPNSLETSRILLPSTITARRTRPRRYRASNLLYIHRTIRRVDYYPMNGARGRFAIYDRRMLGAITRPHGTIYLSPLTHDVGKAVLQSILRHLRRRRRSKPLSSAWAPARACIIARFPCQGKLRRSKQPKLVRQTAEVTSAACMATAAAALYLM